MIAKQRLAKNFTEYHFDIRQDEKGFWYIWSNHGKSIIQIPKANNKRVAMVIYYGDKTTAEHAAIRLAHALLEGAI